MLTDELDTVPEVSEEGDIVLDCVIGPGVCDIIVGRGKTRFLVYERFTDNCGRSGSNVLWAWPAWSLRLDEGGLDKILDWDANEHDEKRSSSLALAWNNSDTGGNEEVELVARLDD